MARVLYGNTPADFTLGPSGRIIPNVALTVWTAESGGTQVTDLLDYANAPVSTVTSDDSGLVRFYGPDGTDSTLWIQSGSSTRLAVRPVNLPRPDLEIGTVTTGTADVTLTPNGLEGYTMDLVLPTAGANGVNTAAIQNDAVTADKIAANAVGASELADNAVDTNAIANDAVTAAKIAADAVGSSEIAAGAVGTSELADAAVTAAKLGSDVRIGNLLTANQASVETDTTGLHSGFNATVTRDTSVYYQGAASMKAVAVATNTVAFGDSVGTAVTAGETYTAVAMVRAGNAVTIRTKIQWYNSGGTYLSENAGSYVTANATWVQTSVTAVAPANAALARVYHETASATAGDAFWADARGLWRGASGVWAMPGIPIVHTGIRPNPANTAQVQIWNEATATWITV